MPTKSAKQIAAELHAYGSELIRLAQLLDPLPGFDDQLRRRELRELLLRKLHDEPEPAPEVEVKPRPPRRPKLSLSTVSVAARDMKGPFSVAALALRLGYPYGTVLNKVHKLAEKGTLTRTGGARGPSVKFEFVKPTGPPVNRRSITLEDERKIGVGAASMASGRAVGTTGQPKGRSGSMGADKRKQQQGHKLQTGKKRGHS